MAKHKWRWVTRDNGGYNGSFVRIHMAKNKPKESIAGVFYSDGYGVMLAGEFANITGITINPGDCVKVEFSAKAVEP